MRLSIRRKLLGAVGFGLATLVGLGVFALYKMAAMESQASRMTEQTIPALRNVDQVRTLVWRFRTLQLEYLKVENDADRDRLQRAMDEVEIRMDHALGSHREILSADAPGPGNSLAKDSLAEEESRALAALRASWERYVRAHHRRFLPQVERMGGGTVQPALSRLNPLHHRLLKDTDALARLGERRAGEAMAAVGAQYRTSRRFIVGLTLLLLALCGGFGWLLTTSLARRVERLRTAARRVAEGDLGVETGSRTTPLGGGDELTDLALQFDQMIASLRRQRTELEERNRALQASLQAQHRLNDDLLTREKAEAEALRARAEAEAASSAKSHFLATMSHELRTPLNAILGYAQVMALEAEAAGEERKSADVERILAAGRHLMTLISNVLDFSKIEQGKMDVEVLDFELGELVREVAELLRPMAEDSGNRLEVVAEGDVPGPVPMRSDPAKVRQILFNLLSNAVKFTEDGTIRVVLRRRESTHGPRVWLEVRDTGIGIEDERLERLFEPFRQADRSITRRFGGTGLGLVVSRQLAELLGGRLEAESTPGEGSTFRVLLPLQIRLDLDDSTRHFVHHELAERTSSDSAPSDEGTHEETGTARTR